MATDTLVNDHSPDLTNCDREPIHIPGRIQPHGLLLTLSEPDFRVMQISSNSQTLAAVDSRSCFNKPLGYVIGSENAQATERLLREQAPGADGIYLLTIRLAATGMRMHIVAHRFDDVLILELEPAGEDETLSFQSVHVRIRAAVAELQRSVLPLQVCAVVAEQVRRVTGFDRVMVYRFDDDWNGQVIAESRADDLATSYAGHHFPASDIPRQARELYRLNRLRIIPDANYAPADLQPAVNPQTAKPLDLSFSMLRSVSPIHLEYLRNMGVRASMSVSIVKDEKLWGLVACHHRTRLFVPYEVRTACDFLGQVAALQIGFAEYSVGHEYRLELNARGARLLAYMTGRDDFMLSLLEHEADLLGVVGATGAALVADDELHCVGNCPPRHFIAALAKWLGEKRAAPTYHTDCLPREFAAADSYQDSASGLISLSLPRSRAGQSYLLWFRPEVIRTITWAGDPNEPVETLVSGDSRIRPRRSFESWKQTVRSRSSPWRIEEIDAAAALRESIVGIVLRQAEELAQVNARLQRSNKELEAFSYSVSHDLRAPFRHIAGFSSLLRKHAAEKLDETSRRYIQTIEDSARYAGTLVDSLLAFSQMGRISLRQAPVDMNVLFAAVRDEVVSAEGAGRKIDWRIDPLPTVHADAAMLRLAVRNLLSNAVKYSRSRDPANIRIGYRLENEEHLFFVQDNGVGFDMTYVDKLFGVFQRLHRVDEFEGTGIGLANVRRIIERHGGKTWATGEVDHGSTFFFTLPAQTPQLTEQPHG